jgi:hypothetical protein
MRFSTTVKAMKAGATTPAFCFLVAGHRAAIWPRFTWATDACSAVGLLARRRSPRAWLTTFSCPRSSYYSLSNAFIHAILKTNNPHTTPFPKEGARRHGAGYTFNGEIYGCWNALKQKPGALYSSPQPGFFAFWATTAGKTI